MSKGNIFIVEDSFIVSLHLQTILESSGYNVIGKFDSGEKALSNIEQIKPDIIFMDIMLNGAIDGIQTTAAIKTKFDIPVIYISALTDVESLERAKATKPSGYVTKPFEDHEIFAVLNTALRDRGI